MLRERMREGKVAVGSFGLGHDPAVVRVAEAAGLDFLLLDYEHGTLTDSLCSQFVDVAAGLQVSLFIRCTMSDLPFVARLFDHGLDGILVAGATSVQDVSHIVQTVKFPPLGKRGLNPFVAAAEFGVQHGDDFVHGQNKRSHIWILAENQAMLADLPQISQLPGIDGVFLGPYDLSVDLGVAGDIHHPIVAAKIEEAMTVLRRYQICAGIYAKDKDVAIPWVQKGMSFVVVGFDWSLLQTAWANTVEFLSRDSE